VRGFLDGRRKAKTNRMMRSIAPGAVFIVIVSMFVILMIGQDEVCCTIGVFVGLIGVLAFAIMAIGWGYVVVEPTGYWKKSDQDYEKAVTGLEKLLSDEKGIAFERVDVSRFFQVEIKTTFYLLDITPFPVYVIVWKDGDKAQIHLGPRRVDDTHQHKPLAKRIAWST